MKFGKREAVTHTIGGQQEEGSIRPSAPTDLVDLFFDLNALQEVELCLVALEFCVELVLYRKSWACC